MGSLVNSSVTNAYLWRDGALIQTGTHDSNTGSGSNPIWTTNYSYNRRNDLLLADINDGRPRDVTYVTDLNGQIIRRDEADTVGANGDPHERTCRFAGKQIEVYWLSRFPPKTAWHFSGKTLWVGNNGSSADFGYAASIADRQVAQGPAFPELAPSATARPPAGLTPISTRASPSSVPTARARAPAP